MPPNRQKAHQIAFLLAGADSRSSRNVQAQYYRLSGTCNACRYRLQTLLKPSCKGLPCSQLLAAPTTRAINQVSTFRGSRFFNGQDADASHAVSYIVTHHCRVADGAFFGRRQLRGVNVIGVPPATVTRHNFGRFFSSVRVELIS